MNWPPYVYGLTWLSDSVFEGDSTDGLVTGDIAPGEVHLSISSAERESRSHSPGGLYSAECTRDGIRLYRAAESEAFAETVLSPALCDYPELHLRWSPDEKSIAFVAKGGTVYVWNVADLDPIALGKTDAEWSWPNWSPNSQRLVVVDTLPGTADYLTYNILYRDGRPMKITNAQLSNRSEASLYWVSDIIVQYVSDCGAGCGYVAFYDVEAGQLLIGDIIDNLTDYQGPDISPDGRWMVVDYSENFEPYTLYDFQTRQEFPLMDSQAFRLDFVGWANEGSVFYAIKSQVTPATPGPSEPASALVAFHPATRRWDLVVDKAIAATPSESWSKFFVTLQEPLANGAQQIEVAFTSRAGQSLTAPQIVSSESGEFEQNAWHQTATWSHDESRVAFLDAYGNLRLLDQNGELKLLASRNDFSSNSISADSLSLLWSPTDTYLLVVARGSGAWVVSP